MEADEHDFIVVPSMKVVMNGIYGVTLNNASDCQAIGLTDY